MKNRATETARFSLPETVNPTDFVCYKVPVPNDPYHIAAFKGSIYKLGRAFSWANDESHTAIDVAAVWMDIFNNLEECEMISFRQLESCVLEYSTDGGSTWDVAYDGAACVREGIVDAIHDGTLSGGSQPPAGGDGTPGVCYTYHVTLHGNDRWNSPLPVDNSDVITVSNVQGAWWNGNIGNGWFCGDGESYRLGFCLGTGHITGSGNPIPSANEMRLIGNIPGESVPFFDMFNESHVVSGLGAPDDFFLQANDATLTDNQGALTFDVEICKDAGYIHLFEFSVSEQGWVVRESGEGSWNSSGYWEAGTSRLVIEIDIPSGSGNIRAIEAVDYDYTRGTGFTQGKIVLYNGATNVAERNATYEGTALSSRLDGLDNQGTKVQLNYWRNGDGNSTGVMVLRRFKIEGRGPDPF